ncbi:acyl-CoA dehydrogenase family protein [Pseudooceanicola batsensis]|uniref:acyl-CoA dehydrogenase family protein n=1 Tax=Pseudooceanicola batsensis TaxID=314255 RepID=UPI003898ED7C
MGAEGEAFAIAKHYLNVGRCFVSFTCLGLSIAAYEAALRYAGEREQFGRKIAGFQLVQQMIAEMMTGAETSRLLACRATDALDRGGAGSRPGLSHGQAPKFRHGTVGLRDRLAGARRGWLHP